MGYKRNEYRFRNAIEIEEYHTFRYPDPGGGRRPRRNPTPEKIERINQKNREKRCRHLLRKYFKVTDYYVTLTYEKAKRPKDMEEAKRHFRNFIQKLKRRFKKAGNELRWIRAIEVGSKGGWHIHMVVNRIPDLILLIEECWEHGVGDYKLLKRFREFAKLAEYLTKNPKLNKKVKEQSYSSSRNMVQPIPIVKTYNRWKTWHKVRIPKGWYLDEESYYEGENPFTGYPCRSYTLLRLEPIVKEE